MRLDEQIKKDIVNQFYWDGRIDASDISVKVDGGDVTLSGSVPSFSARQAAAEDTWSVRGVRTIDNRLTIVYPMTAARPLDQEIKENIQRSFSWNSDLAQHKLTASVAKGRVTLEGTVNAYWKKMAAETEAFSTRGVSNVTNKITVVPTEDVVDELVAEQVVDTLGRDARVSVDDVDVLVRDGQVTLSGAVPSVAARDAAYNAALYTTGVTEVNNNLTILTPEAIAA